MGLPEAFTAISVRAVIGLLRLKTNPTPVIVLRNCVTDTGAAQLVDALQMYGAKANVEALELPQNPFTEVGIQRLMAAPLLDGSTLQEIDISYNPHLGDA